MNFNWKLLPNGKTYRAQLFYGNRLIGGGINWDKEKGTFSPNMGFGSTRKLFDTPEEAEQWARQSAIRQLKKALKELEVSDGR